LINKHCKNLQTDKALCLLFPFSENLVWSQIAMLTTSAEEQRSQFKALSVTVPKPFVYHVELNRPKKLNAMNNTMWM
jgi:hypothetical protein